MPGALSNVVAGVRDYEELEVYQLADQLEQLAARIIVRSEFQMDADVREQIKRASEKLCPNIAEGFARYYPRENARFVGIAKASCSELIVHLISAGRKGLIPQPQADEACRLARRTRAAATSYIRYLRSCKEPPG